jgi:biopolymer transport protein ExbB
MDKTAAARSGLDIIRVIDGIGYAIYVAIGLLAIWGAYNVILLYRGIAKKSIRDGEAASLIGQVRDLGLGKGNFEGALAVCQGPPHWHSALAQLMAVALKARSKGLAKVKQMLVTEFHTEVVSGLESRLASISTAAKMGPLLGLLGTVLSMIAAFGKMGEGQKADPSSLASAIGLGLWTTAAGLIISNPLMVLGNDLQSRLRRLRDRTERHLQDFLEVLEQYEAQTGRNAAAARSSGSMRAVLPR